MKILRTFAILSVTGSNILERESVSRLLSNRNLTVSEISKGVSKQNTHLLYNCVAFATGYSGVGDAYIY